MTPKYSVNDRVVIVYNPNAYRGKYTYEHGAVKKTFVRNNECFYGVKLDNHSNIQSELGLYWFSVKVLN